MAPVGFESTISAGERPQTYALDGVATGTGVRLHYTTLLIIRSIRNGDVLSKIQTSVFATLAILKST